jgi:alkanesulfonate monooxygenase SsuD/methylene tetrahydromethanopterin reductase-like flavin-dependent oxidoreductase (luciferase family)
MRIGVTVPLGYGDLEDGRAPTFVQTADFGSRAEKAGLDSIWVFDHLIFRFPNEPDEGLQEAWTTLSALASVVPSVELGTLVMCSSFRNAGLMAKMGQTLDDVSGGRLILGLGCGWHEPEYAAFGYPFDHRVGRFAEALQIIVPLLRTGQVDVAGTYYQARDCELRPRGPRRAGPPVMIGTTGARMLRLTAEYADIWNAWALNTPKEVSAAQQKVDAACVEMGREPATLQRSCSILVDLPGRAGRPREDGSVLIGNPETLANSLWRHTELGISHVQVVLDPNNLSGIEKFALVLEQLDGGS